MGEQVAAGLPLKVIRGNWKDMYLENCIQRNIDDKIKKYLIKTSEVMLTNIN